METVKRNMRPERFTALLLSGYLLSFANVGLAVAAQQPELTPAIEHCPPFAPIPTSGKDSGQE